MTVVYVDTLFVLNSMVDYLLLLAGARLAGEPLHRIRFGAAAALGGLYAVALFLPGLMFLERWPCRIASAVLMLLVAYGGGRRLLRQSLIFFALVCAFGGGIMCVSLNGGQSSFLRRGIAHTTMDVKVMLVSAAVCYVVLTAVFQRLGAHTRLTGGLASAKVCLGRNTVEITALVDTGNTLSDPVTGKRVMVAEGSCLGGLFPGEYCPRPDDLLEPVRAMERLGRGEWRGKFRLLPYRAVGVERGLLLAVRVDGLYINGEKTDITLVALSPTPVSDGGGYRALIGPAD